MSEYGIITPWFARMEFESPEHDGNLGKQWSAEWVFDKFKARSGWSDTLDTWLNRVAMQPDQQPGGDFPDGSQTIWPAPG
jgi:hypothetical protein